MYRRLVLHRAFADEENIVIKHIKLPAKPQPGAPGLARLLRGVAIVRSRWRKKMRIRGDLAAGGSSVVIEPFTASYATNCHAHGLG